jgi:Zinc carboxypeptidase
MKQLFSTFLLTFLLGLQVTWGQTQSPSQFFGFEYGTRFVPHHRGLAYYEHIVAQYPKQAKLIRYGESIEGRPLVVLVMASEENFSKLEEIRTNHLKEIGLTAGTPSGKTAAICWLSYDVHGNEACATTAALPMPYEILNPNNSLSKSILSNTVVVIDPCLNPDGYDRYVNWYNQKVGSVVNVNSNDWQHAEPWPGGRFNHYCFDLNRDWQWQTQKESMARTTLYQQWMPHLHADFHEQNINSPYYFPPSAKPFHEDITAWQREMQGVVGEYQRKYFDKNAWTYFTRENFDLFYPSYGDTYPTYNGAIGYTLEQGGSGRAGLGVLTEVGDTLTLKDRYEHHYASGWAAMEALSSRAEKAQSEFVKFFDNARNNPNGIYKSFVFKTKGEEHKIQPFLAYLDKQGFQYGIAGKSMVAGSAYSYQEDRTVSVSIEPEDVVVSLYQPRSTMLKILLEPKSALEDSLTYDITSWSLPYSYGLKGYALKDKLSPQTYNSQSNNTSANLEKPYAYLIRWKGNRDAKTLAQLMLKKVRSKRADNPFEIANQSFAAGTILLLRADNRHLGDNFDTIVQQICQSNKANYLPVSTGYVSKGADLGSNYVSTLKAPKVAIVGGDGTSPTGFGDVWHYFDQDLKYPVTVIGSDNFGRINLDDYTTLVLPEGGYGKMLSDGNVKKIKEWVSAGGKLILVGGANQAFADKEGFELKHKKEDDKKKDEKQENDLKIYGNQEREGVSQETPGSIYKINLDTTNPLAFGYDKNYHALVLEASDYAYLKDGWNVGYNTSTAPIAGFAGKKAKEKLTNALLFGTQNMGQGSVVYFINNTLFRGFWENGKLLFANAVFQVK